MTRNLKSLNDSDLDLICGGSTLIADSFQQAFNSRQRPDAADDAVSAGSQGGGSATYDEMAQYVETPA